MEKFEICYICGNSICEQDISHEKITQTQFEDLLSEKAGYSPDIAHLKSKVRKAFYKLEKYKKIKLDHFVRDVSLLLDKLHFWFLLQDLNSLNEIQAAVFGYSLPKRQLARLVSSLKKQHQNRIQFPAFKLLLRQVHNFKKSIKKIAEFQAYNSLLQRLSFLIIEEQKMYVCRKTCMQYPNIPKQLSIQQDYQQFVLIEGIPFNTKRKTIDISMLQVDDQKLMRIMPALQKMNFLTNLQIRNNTISKRGYKMLFNAIPQLEEVDVSNSNSQQFLEVASQKLHNLKAIYLNQTGMNNQEKLLKLMLCFPKLKVLLLDNNNITSDMISSMVQACSGLFYVSLKGNLIKQEQGQKLIVNFMMKGGYLEY